jgi:hypothetical protein
MSDENGDAREGSALLIDDLPAQVSCALLRRGLRCEQ